MICIIRQACFQHSQFINKFFMAIYFFIIYAVKQFFIPPHDIISFAPITHISKTNAFLPIFSISPFYTPVNAHRHFYIFFADVRI